MSPEGPAYRTYFNEARKRAEDMAIQERADATAGIRPWGAYRTPLRNIEKNMGRILGESFGSFLKKRHNTRGQVFAMDVMGMGGFADRYPVDGEIAITLTDPRNDEQKQNDISKNKKVIEGDILVGKTWKEADDFIKKYDTRDVPGFDLITCRPFGGWKIVKESLSASEPEALLTEWLVVNRMVRSLNPDGGTLLVDMSGSISYDNWVQKLRQVDGINVAHHGNFIKIARNQRMYGRLPYLAA